MGYGNEARRDQPKWSLRIVASEQVSQNQILYGPNK